MPQVVRKGSLIHERLQIKLFGDWDKTVRILNRLGPDIKKASLDAQMKLCQEVKHNVLGHLMNQDLGWASLNRHYSRKKGRKELDSRTLIAYGIYYHAIDAWTVGNQHLAMVGVRTGIYTRKMNGKRNPLEVARIALIHEFSRGNKIPRRPLWNPTIREMGGAKGFKKIYNHHLVNLLRRRGVPIKVLNNKLF